MFGEKNVTGIAAVHYPLRNIQASTGNVGLAFYIHNTLTGPLCTPIRSGKRMSATRPISIAHCTGASGLV